MSRTWVVTGGVGFIGYHVTHALLSRGDRVTVIDDFSDAPYPARYKRRNARDLVAAFSDVRIVEASVTDRAAIDPLFDGASAVIHLAGLAGVRSSIETPAHYASVNVVGTSHVLEIARARGIRHVAFASSSSVYGDDTPLPAKEDAPSVGPESPYGASKRAAELLAQSIAKSAPSLNVTALRFFTVYGPRQRPEMAIALFTRAMLEGRPITVFGDGSMRRDFTHVDDIVRGVLLASEGARSNARSAGYRVYNLGSSAPVDLRTLVSLLRAATGVESLVKYAPAPPGDVIATYADTRRAEAELGWKAKVALADGLETVVKWVRENES